MPIKHMWGLLLRAAAVVNPSSRLQASGMKSPVKRRSGLFPRLLSVDSQTDKQTYRRYSQLSAFDLELARPSLPNIVRFIETGLYYDFVHI